MSERNTNHVTLVQFEDMNKKEEDQIPIDQLYELQSQIIYNKRDAADLAARLTSAILRRCETAGRATLKQLGKDTGTTTVAGDTDYNYKMEIPKKVEWDQAKLRRVVEQLDEEGKNIEEYVTVTLGVAEAKYNSWPNEIRARFQDARMVKDAPAKAEVVTAKRK